ncbi:MAG: DUF2129 domain-containing protein [Lactobacillus sp.]|nr:DUF2129 domain-containing protein [Lactobacillus sp.]
MRDQELKDRQAIIVFLKKKRDHYRIKKIGNLVYFSKKDHYCIVYVNQDKALETLETLKNKPYVSKAYLSKAETINLDGGYLEGQLADLKEKYEAELAKRKEKEELL